MDPAVLGTKLASSLVAPLVKKLFLPDGPGAGLVDKPVRLSALVSFRGEKRTLSEKDVGKLSAHLIRQAVESPGERPFPADEEIAVTDALTRKLLTLGDLDMDDVQAVRLGHRELARKLHHRCPTPSHLSADSAFFLDSVTEWACVHVLNFFTQRSTFIARTLVEQSQLLTELLARLDELITRSPRRDSRDASFERRYLRYLTERHSRITIYGIDLHNSPERWPLDTAYLSLEATAPERSVTVNVPAGALDTGVMDVSPKAMGELVRYCAENGFDDVSIGAAADAEGLIRAGRYPYNGGPRPADQALAGLDRVLLRGVAGSGKTTLVQWLAVSAARPDPEDRMAYLRDRIPFVLPLRTLTRHGERLPSPDRFLEAADLQIAGVPEGWADRVLTAGRGLILVDGIDEVPERERARTREWLRDLLALYAGNRWLVTSRPSAVREDWLADESFTELALSPMSRFEVTAFVERWHRAAEAESYEESLHTDLRSKHDLARLATNPLMCGLICALHRDRRGFLPNNRKELYDAALSMLLARRDRERDMGNPTGIELGEGPQIQLLQRLAYWLTVNGRTEMDRSHAESLIAKTLPAIPSAAAQGPGEAVFDHLLHRSGLLREPSPRTIDFVHRTFQDYLAAKAIIEEWHIGVLTEHAADDQWEDVIRMTVAHAYPRERTQILRELLEQGDRAGDRRTRIRTFLVAAACLDDATEITPEITAAVRARTARLIPPRSREEALELATAGRLVLDQLPGPDGLTPDQALNTVIAATRIDDEAAIPFLAQFTGQRSLGIRAELDWAWSRFETEPYAREIIARLEWGPLYIRVRNSEQLSALLALGGRPRLDLRGSFTHEELARAVEVCRPTGLQLVGNERLRDLTFLAGASRLTSLYITDCRALLDLAPLAALPLESLGLHQVTGDMVQAVLDVNVNGGPLRPLGSLTFLTLDVAGSAELDLGHVAMLFPNLDTLDIVAHDLEHLDLSPLARLARLIDVHLAVPDATCVITGEEALSLPVDITPVFPEGNH